MFFVSDDQSKRHKLIKSFLKDDRATIAVVLAAIDFEWSVRRAILALGTSPTKEIRKEGFYGRGGYDSYKEKWEVEVAVWLKKTLPNVVPQWPQLKNGAMQLRGRIVHGANVPIRAEDAKPHVENWLAAAVALEKLAQENKTSLYRRVVRIKRRVIAPPGGRRAVRQV